MPVHEVSCIISENADVLWRFQRQGVVNVLQQNDACGAEFTDKICVVPADVDVALGVVSPVVQVLCG